MTAWSANTAAILFCAIAASAVPGSARAQATVSPQPEVYRPITRGERIEWIVNGGVAPQNLGVGVLTASWLTALNAPEEWKRSWSGFRKRYLEREADVGIANTIEAGLGAMWGEDPRYRRSRGGGIWSRVGHAARGTVMAPGRSGRLRPAWARYAGKTLNTAIENQYLPPTATTGRATTVRIMDGFLGRFAGNLFQEFWPDVRAALAK